MFDTKREYGDNLIDLLKAYAQRRQLKVRHQSYTVRKLPTWSIVEARSAIERMMGGMNDWGAFDIWLEEYLVDPCDAPVGTRFELYREP